MKGKIYDKAGTKSRFTPQGEYGGYLPLEISKSRGSVVPGCVLGNFARECDIRRYNCGRTAIYAAAQTMKADVKKIYVPYYICHTAVHAIEQSGLEIERFSLNENLEPAKEIPIGEAGVLIVNYFGIKNNFITQTAKKYPRMILDCTQALFFAPVMQIGINNIYSCRKFIGVPDGAYLIGKDTCAKQFETGNSWEYYSFLCKAHEMGTNSAYDDSLKNEKRFDDHYEGMSLLTRRFLEGVDYRFIAQKRTENFNKLEELLRNINRFDLRSVNGIPQCYPLWLTRNIGQNLKEKLLEKNIYIPTLWKECREICNKDSLEVEWANNLLCIPVDQRYSIQDMEYLAQIITDYVKEIKE